MPWYSAIYGSDTTLIGGAVKPSIGTQFWDMMGDAFKPLNEAFESGPVIEPTAVEMSEFPKLPKVTDDIMKEFDTGEHGFIEGEFDAPDILDIPEGIQPPITEVADDIRGLNLARVERGVLDFNEDLRRSLESLIGDDIPEVLTGYERLAAARNLKPEFADAPWFEDAQDLIYEHGVYDTAPDLSAQERGLASKLLDQREYAINKTFYDNAEDPWLAHPSAAEDFDAAYPIADHGAEALEDLRPSWWQRLTGNVAKTEEQMMSAARQAVTISRNGLSAAESTTYYLEALEAGAEAGWLTALKAMTWGEIAESLFSGLLTLGIGLGLNFLGNWLLQQAEIHKQKLLIEYGFSEAEDWESFNMEWQKNNNDSGNVGYFIAGHCAYPCKVVEPQHKDGSYKILFKDVFQFLHSTDVAEKNIGFFYNKTTDKPMKNWDMPDDLRAEFNIKNTNNKDTIPYYPLIPIGALIKMRSDGTMGIVKEMDHERKMYRIKAIPDIRGNFWFALPSEFYLSSIPYTEVTKVPPPSIDEVMGRFGSMFPDKKEHEKPPVWEDEIEKFKKVGVDKKVEEFDWSELMKNKTDHELEDLRNKVQTLIKKLGFFSQNDEVKEVIADLLSSQFVTNKPQIQAAIDRAEEYIASIGEDFEHSFIKTGLEKFVPLYRQGQKWNLDVYKIVITKVPTISTEPYLYLKFNQYAWENEMPDQLEVSESWLTDWIDEGYLTTFTPFIDKPDLPKAKDKFTGIPEPKVKKEEVLPKTTIDPFIPKYNLMQKWNVGDDGEWKMVLVKIPTDKTEEYAYVLVDTNWKTKILEGAFTYISEDFIDKWILEGEISEYTPFNEVLVTQNKLPLTTIGQFKKKRIRTGIPFINHRSLMAKSKSKKGLFSSELRARPIGHHESTPLSQFFEEFQYYHTRDDPKDFEEEHFQRRSYHGLTNCWFLFMNDEFNYQYRYRDQYYTADLPTVYRRYGLKGRDTDDKWNDETQQLATYAAVPRFFLPDTSEILCQRGEVETLLERHPFLRCYETLHLIGDCLKLKFFKCYGPNHFTRREPLPIMVQHIFETDCNLKGFKLDFDDDDFMQTEDIPDDIQWYTSKLRSKDTRSPFFCNVSDDNINEALENGEWFFYTPEHFEGGLYEFTRGLYYRMWPLVDTYYQLAKKLIQWNQATSEVMDPDPEDDDSDLFSEVFAFQDPLFIDLLKKSVRSNNQEHYKPAAEFSLDEINERLNQLNYVIRGWKKIFNGRLSESPEFLALLELERNTLRTVYQSRMPEPDYPMDPDFEHELLEIALLEHGRKRQDSPRFQTLPPSPQGAFMDLRGDSSVPDSAGEQKQGSRSTSAAPSPEPYNFEQELANHNFRVPVGSDPRNRLIIFAQQWVYFLTDDPFFVPDFNEDDINRWFHERLRFVFRSFIQVNVEKLAVHPVDFIDRTTHSTGLFKLNLTEEARLQFNENQVQLAMCGIAYPDSNKEGRAKTIDIKRKEAKLFNVTEFLRFHTLFNQWAQDNPLDISPSPSRSSESMAISIDNRFQQISQARSYTRTPASLTRSRSVSRSHSSIDPNPHVPPFFRPITPINQPIEAPALSSGGRTFQRVLEPAPRRARPSIAPSFLSHTESELDRAQTQWSQAYFDSASRVQNTSIFEENITFSFVLSMTLIFLILWALISRRRR